MATETETQTDDSETPPATDPAANGTPPASAAPPKPAAKQPQKRGPEVRIPQAAFKKRIEREAAAEIKRRLGVSIEEAEAMIRKGGGAAPGATSQGVADEVVRKLQAENLKLKNDAEKRRQEAAIAEKKRQREIARLRDRQIETELRYMAKSAGIVDADYACTLFARAAAKDTNIEPEKFFAGLRQSHAYLFTAAPAAPAPEPTVPAATAPPESKQPGETTPPKPTPGESATAPTVDVDKMSPSEFARHTRSYGYAPGT